MTSLLVRTIANIWHQSATLELSPHPRVNTLWSPPAGLRNPKKKTMNIKTNAKNYLPTDQHIGESTRCECYQGNSNRELM